MCLFVRKMCVGEVVIELFCVCTAYALVTTALTDSVHAAFVHGR